MENKYFTFKYPVFEYIGKTENGHHFRNSDIDYYFEEDVFKTMMGDIEIVVSKPVPKNPYGEELSIKDIYLQHGGNVCTISYFKDVNQSSVDIKEKINEIVKKHTDKVIAARNSKKSMLKTSEDSLREILDEKVLIEQNRELITLTGVKKTFNNSWGIYYFYNFADGKEYRVNLNGLHEFVTNGVRYYTNKYSN